MIELPDLHTLPDANLKALQIKIAAQVDAHNVLSVIAAMKQVRSEIKLRKDTGINMGRVWHTELMVAGISFRINSMDEVVSDTVWVEREPDNPHDHNAIAVYMQEDGAKGKQLGFIPKDIAARIPDSVLPSRGRIVWKSTDEKGVGVRISI